MGETGVLAAGLATAAMLWNLVWNRAFDALVPTRRRGLWQRLAQACGFELGLLAMTLPAVAWWMNITLMDALWLNAGFLLFFLAYGVVFNTLFDLAMRRRLAQGGA